MSTAADNAAKKMQEDRTTATDSATVALLFTSLQTSIRDLNGKFDSMKDSQVGWDRCQSMRAACRLECEKNFDDIYPRLRKVETLCEVIDTEHNSLASKTDLMTSEGSVIKKAKDDDGKIMARLDKIDETLVKMQQKSMIFDFTWCHVRNYIIKNRWIQATIAALSLSLLTLIVEVTLGRLKDFGFI